VVDILPPLLDAAFNWLRQGFPVHTIRLVVRDEQSLDTARALFAQQAALLKIQDAERIRGLAIAPTPTTATRGGLEAAVPERRRYAYDVFISYSRKNEAAARHLSERLQQAGLSVFIDRKDIDVGAAWQQTIYEALDDCSMTAVLYSPSFVASKVCKEELNIALMRRRKLDRDLVFPLLVEDTELPTYMEMLNYVDCRVSDTTKIEAAAQRLAASVRAGASPAALH